MNYKPFKDGYPELIEFVAKYNLKDISILNEFKTSIKPIFCKHLTLLVWQIKLKSKKPSVFKSTRQYNSFILHYEEVISDNSQCVLLWSNGLYKPFFLLLRSSIENYVKCLAIYSAIPVTKAKSTHTLFEEVRNSSLCNSTIELKNQFERLTTYYKDLCGYVHTTSRNHMFLTTAVGNFPEFDNVTCEKSKIIMCECTKIYLIFTCYLFKKEFKSMKHKEFDFLCDNLPARVKREIMG